MPIPGATSAPLSRARWICPSTICCAAASVPVHVAVLERDGLGCSWIAAHDVRCGSRAGLEFDHCHPAGKGGCSDPSNLRLLFALTIASPPSTSTAASTSSGCRRRTEEGIVPHPQDACIDIDVASGIRAARIPSCHRTSRASEPRAAKRLRSQAPRAGLGRPAECPPASADSPRGATAPLRRVVSCRTATRARHAACQQRHDALRDLLRCAVLQRQCCASTTNTPQTQRSSRIPGVRPAHPFCSAWFFPSVACFRRWASGA